MGNIGERFKEIRENLGFTQKSFGNIFELSQDSISAIERGKNNPNPNILEILCLKYKVNLNWLIGGNGNKFINESQLEEITDSESIKHEIEELKIRIKKIEDIILKNK